MIKHYLEVHEYINKHIYRLPVGEYQIITEGFGWGMLAGLGIAGLIAIAWKLIDNYMQEHGWGSSGSSSSSKDDEDKGEFSLPRLRSFLNDNKHFNFNDLTNLNKYINDNKTLITNENQYQNFYNNINSFAKIFTYYMKYASYVIINQSSNHQPIVLFNSSKDDNLYNEIKNIDIKDLTLSENRLIEKILNDLKEAKKDQAIIDNIIEYNIDFLNNLNFEKDLYPKLQEKQKDDKWLKNYNSYNNYISKYIVNYYEVNKFLNNLDHYAYYKKNTIESELADYIDNCSESGDYKITDTQSKIIKAIIQDASGNEVDIIIKRIKEAKKEDVLLKKSSIDGSVKKYAEQLDTELNQDQKDQNLDNLKIIINNLSKELKGNMSEVGLHKLAQGVKAYFSLKELQEKNQKGK